MRAVFGDGRGVLLPCPVVLGDARGLTVCMPGDSVQAGFPSPAQDYWMGEIDLGQQLMPNRSATYVVRVAGDSMVGAGIFDGDRVLVDRSLTAGEGDVVIAVVDGEFTVKRLRFCEGRPALFAENPGYPPVGLHDLVELSVWGVVTWVLHRPGRAGS